jgi:hypothetical protein
MGLYCFADFQIGIVNRILKASAWITLGAAVGLLTVFAAGLASGLSLNVFFSDAYGWSYEAPIEWTFCFIACWIIIKAKFNDVLLASTYGVLAVSAGGDLHEAVFGLANMDHY